MSVFVDFPLLYCAHPSAHDDIEDAEDSSGVPPVKAHLHAGVTKRAMHHGRIEALDREYRISVTSFDTTTSAHSSAPLATLPSSTRARHVTLLAHHTAREHAAASAAAGAPSQVVHHIHIEAEPALAALLSDYQTVMKQVSLDALWMRSRREANECERGEGGRKRHRRLSSIARLDFS
jgi:hypothetical protein